MSSSPTVGDISDWLETIAPLALSEAWDNTGLLIGDRGTLVERAMTCLTLTPPSVCEAVARQAQFVIAHHPMPFKPLSKIGTDTYSGGLVWQLARAGVSVYSPHTAWDSAENGINSMLGKILNLQDSRPIVPHALPHLNSVGTGRIGRLPNLLSLVEIAGKLRQAIPECRSCGVDAGRPISRIGIACGSGGSLLGAAITAGSDLFLTGEATFHHCLEAQAAGVSMLLIGHFASECFAMQRLAEMLCQQFPITAWHSQDERDPIVNIA